MKYTLGFIGCGNMGGALIAAASKSVDPALIAVCDRDENKLAGIAEQYGIIPETTENVCAECKYIFLAVKPVAFPALTAQIKGLLKAREDRFVIVTMAAGISIAELSNMLGEGYPIIRIMPNTPVAVGKGVILTSTSSAVTADDLNGFKSALKFAGIIDEVSEPQIDSAGTLTGCGPAFVYMFIDALADGAVECGVPRDKALLYASQMLEGAAEMVISTNKHPGALKDAVCSPGGTTIAGVHALEKHGFRNAVIDAICASYKKTVK